MRHLFSVSSRVSHSLSLSLIYIFFYSKLIFFFNFNRHFIWLFFQFFHKMSFISIIIIDTFPDVSVSGVTSDNKHFLLNEFIVGAFLFRVESLSFNITFGLYSIPAFNKCQDIINWFIHTSNTRFWVVMETMKNNWTKI